MNVGIKTGDSVFNCLLYADDAVLVASTFELETLVTDVNEDRKQKALAEIMVSEKEEAKR